MKPCSVFVFVDKPGELVPGTTVGLELRKWSLFAREEGTKDMAEG